MFGLLTKSLLWQFQFVKYTVYMGMIALDRRKLLDKVVKGSEICEVLHGCPEVQKYLVSTFFNPECKSSVGDIN